jgi:O-antigen ligase
LHIGIFNDFFFFYITLLFLKDKLSKKLLYFSFVALICVFFLSGSMLVNDVLNGAFGQSSYAGNRIQSSFYALEGICLLFFLREQCTRKILYHAISFLITIGYVSIFLCLGRLVTAIAVISALFFLYKGYIRWRTVLTGTLIMLCLVLFNPYLLTSFQKQLIRLPESRHKTMIQYDADEMNAFTSGRSSAYKVAWNLYLKKPFMGIGYDRWAFDLNKGSDGSSMHSRWLQILVEAGPVGASLYLFIYMACFFCLSSKRLFVPSQKEPMRDVLFIALLGFFLIGLTDNIGYSDRIFYLIVAFIASYCETKNTAECT